MIFHSIIPLEVVMDQNNAFNQNVTRIIQYRGRNVEVSDSAGQMQIQRIFSTSLQDFLDPNLQPGTLIGMEK